MTRYLALILCKDHSKDISELENCFSNNSINFLTVCDSKTLDIDKSLLDSGFYNLTRSPYIKKPSAWDKSFYFIEQQKLYYSYDYFFFIEDDIWSYEYISIIKFMMECDNYDSDLITKCIRSKSHHPTWKHWKEDYINEFKFPSQSFNPLCRLSKQIVQKILDYRKEKQKFNFHEIIFASICLENNFTYLNYIENNDINKYIGKIQYYPILTKDLIKDQLIHHPVKDSIDAREKPIVCLDSCR